MGQCVAGNAERGRTARALRGTFARRGLFPIRPHEFAAVHDLGAGLIGQGVASEQSLRRVYNRQRCGFYVTREEGQVTGAMALVMLNEAGFDAVRTDNFDANTPDTAHEILPGEAPRAVYGWGIAAATRDSARAIVTCCWALLDTIPRPFFLRVATEAGRRLLADKMDFAPWPGSTTGLLWLDAGARLRRAA